MPISSPPAWPDTIATRGRIVSGSAVPTAASTLPTTPSDSPKPSPIHSTPFVNSSAPPRMTSSDVPSRTHSIGRASCHTAGCSRLLRFAEKGSSPQAGSPSSRPRVAARRVLRGGGDETFGLDRRVGPRRFETTCARTGSSKGSIEADSRSRSASRSLPRCPALVLRVTGAHVPHGRGRPALRARDRRRRRSSCRGRPRSRSSTSRPGSRSRCSRSSRCCPSTPSTWCSRGRAATRCRQFGAVVSRAGRAGRVARAPSRSRT